MATSIGLTESECAFVERVIAANGKETLEQIGATIGSGLAGNTVKAKLSGVLKTMRESGNAQMVKFAAAVPLPPDYRKGRKGREAAPRIAFDALTARLGKLLPKSK